MSIAFLFESATIDQSGYDGLMKAIGRESIDAPAPPGFIAHLSGPRAEGGWRVVDLWESEDAANAFYGSEEFQPVTEAAADAGIAIVPWPMRRVEVDQTIRQMS